MKTIPNLVEDYVVWLRDKTQVREIGQGWHEITTPFLDHHNDMIQIFARRENDRIRLTDDGYTLTDLAHSGCEVDSSPKRRATLAATLAGFGVRRVGDALEISASDGDFAAKKHSLMQAMLVVNDMFMLAQSNVAGIFVEDLYAWLDAREIRYTPQAKFAGQTGFDHVFDAVIPKSRMAPERLLKAIGNPAKDRIQTAIFAWTDTRKNRAADSQLYAIINDTRKVAPDTMGAFKSYEIKPILWSEREDYTGALVA